MEFESIKKIVEAEQQADKIKEQARIKFYRYIGKK